MENMTGWKVIITVPQLNGGNDQHLWVAAIPDESEVRKRLWLDQMPCVAHFEPLSLEEFRGLELERGEVRRIILPSWTATPVVLPVVNEVVDPEPKLEMPEPKPEEHVSPPMDPDDPGWDQSEEAAQEGSSSDNTVEISHPTEPDDAGMGSKPQEAAEEGSWSDEGRDHEVFDSSSEPARSDRLWRRLWRVRQRSDHG